MRTFTEAQLIAITDTLRKHRDVIDAMLSKKPVDKNAIPLAMEDADDSKLKGASIAYLDAINEINDLLF